MTDNLYRRARSERRKVSTKSGAETGTISKSRDDSTTITTANTNTTTHHHNHHHKRDEQV